MKLGPKLIWDTWQGAQAFVGQTRPCSRVTVEPNWWFNALEIAGWSGRIAHWWQRADNSQVEYEVPNLASVQWDRSLSQDAATATITLHNTWMDANVPQGMPIGPPPTIVGKPGWFSWLAPSAEGVARWGKDTSPWRNVLTPNALLRTYQGYGGHDKTIAQGLADGNLTQTGVWLIDTPEVDSNGTLTLTCRDMASVLVDGFVYPPMVPGALYPFGMRFSRFYFTTSILPDPTSVDTSGELLGGKPIPPGEVVEQPRRVANASSIKSFPPDGNVLNHLPKDACDDDPDSFYYSIGRENPTDLEWIEFDTTGNGKPDVVNVIRLSSFGPDAGSGAYHFYVSVMENNAWVVPNDPAVPSANRFTPTQTSGLIPADAYYAGTPYNTDIAYVAEGDLAYDFEHYFSLPRSYNAERIRITLTNLPKTLDGPPYLRAGVREFAPCFDNVANLRFGAVRIVGITALPNGQGYWAVSSIGEVINFGGAPLYGDGSPIVYNQPVAGIASTPDSNGYWLVAVDGGVFTYGTAPYLGALPPGPGGLGVSRTDVVGLAPTPTGKGYWIACADGSIYSFGDALYHGGANELGHLNAPVVGIAAVPTGQGYWLVAADGGVFAFGNARFYGTAETLALNMPISGITPTPAGDGYWLSAQDGGVFAFGAAGFFGSVPGAVPAAGAIPISTPQPPVQPEVGPNPGHITSIAADYFGDGYWMIDDNGNVYSYGGATNYGGFYHPTRRTDGNFVDWADVVQTILLWCGWHLYGAQPEVNGSPAVHGVLEQTGIPGPHPIDNGLQSYDLLEDQVCKKPPIDIIKQVRDIVGYAFWVDDWGAAMFVSPNWWSPGNFDENQNHVPFVPLIDERTTLIEYQATDNKSSMRSEIIVSSNEPTADIQGTVTTTYVPAVNEYLHGLPMPLLHNDMLLASPAEQKTYAQLAGLRLWISQRTGSVTIAANPCLQINDQVQLAERNAQDTFLHYVREINCTHDLDAGTFTMQLTTNWLGDNKNWAVDFTDPTSHQPSTSVQTTSTPQSAPTT